MSKYDYVIRTSGEPVLTNGISLDNALADIDRRLSALEAAAEKAKQADEEIERDWEALVKRLHATPLQPKVEATAPPQTREPGLYVVKISNDLYGLRRWSQKGGWVTQSGYDTFESQSDYIWIGPRIQEPEE